MQYPSGIAAYKARGFKLQNVLGDGRFERIRKHIEAVKLYMSQQTCPRDTKVHEGMGYG